MRRAVRWLVAGVLVLGCAGCGGGSEGAPSAEFTPFADVTWQPVENADPVIGVNPSPLRERADLAAAVAARAGARDRQSAESFAVQAAQVLTDDRHGVSGNQVLGAIASERLPANVRRYLTHDVDSMQASGLERHLDPAAGVWIRSRLVGSTAAPSRVEVEIAAVILSERWTFRKWYRTRYDVAWENNRWSLVGFSDGSFGPTTVPLTPAERRDFLPGTGWRHVPPS